ncbi:uncharacterized protein LAESUDRAFT_728387 [Laetiporus sulphureus 93-53]|uniref:Uncharacterized protein n=1 Tax=Laetiporus sulphureus 93-53 TaxID=1314785 RepID=A0A165D505_9APHY|nr:uncharacterized protein LAESUDRAFT_728387 [Laetiporus sulphureus 93-53]KZT04165.1 hypothetical protein LAESUDRAFT_728387 [Laetiporus sulphureus 93-53]
MSPAELNFYNEYFSYLQSEKPFAMQRAPRRHAATRAARTTMTEQLAHIEAVTTRLAMQSESELELVSPEVGV